MFTKLLEILNPLYTDIAKQNEIKESISHSQLSNNLVAEITSSLLVNTPNSVTKIVYSIIKDNPYAIFLFIVMTVFMCTIILRILLYLITYGKYSSKRNIVRKLWKIFLSPKFIWIGLLLGIIVGVDVLTILPTIKHTIKGCCLSVLLWILYVIIQKILHLYTRSFLIFRTQGTRIKFFKNKNIFLVFVRILYTAWFLIFITIFLGLWGVELGPILAGLGIVGIVVGLALQDTLSHILGGISLMLDETYSEGDYVILDQDNEGVIFHIGYRSTKLRTFDDEIIIIPNGILCKMIITNLSQPVKRIRVTRLYRTYAEDAVPSAVKELLLCAAKNTTNVLKYPEPYVFFLEPSGTQYVFRLNFYVNSPIYRLSNTDFVQQEIVKLFSENNIRFAPTESNVHIDHDTKK